MRPTTLIAAALAAVPLASAQNDLISALGMYPVCGVSRSEPLKYGLSSILTESSKNAQKRLFPSPTAA